MVNVSCCQWRNRMIVHLLVLIFGISTWIGINGIYVQVPVLINTAAEGWALPSYLVVVIQAANLGPIVYMILQHFRWRISEPWWILCLLFSGSCAMGLLSFFHSERTVINGSEHSLAFFILTFLNALVGCFGSVLFMPYLQNFPKSYLVSFFIGEGLSGVLPSIMALVQGGVDDSDCRAQKSIGDPSFDLGLKFSTGDYFLLIFIVLFVSLAAFIVLEFSSFANSVKVRLPNDISIISNKERNNKEPRYCLYTLLAVCCFFGNGFLPSVQSYSCLPYGPTTYKLSVILAQFANPLVCLLAYRYILDDIRSIIYLFAMCSAIGSYVIVIAFMSPFPPLRETTFGGFLVVAAWTVLLGLISYLKLTIVSVLKTAMLPKVLLKAGAFMQLGSTIGAVFSFLAINYTDYFVTYDPCNP